MNPPPSAFNPTPAPPLVRLRSLRFLALALGLFVLFFFRLGNYPFFDIDEPHYAQAAREMLLRHDWITPWFNGLLRLEKPVFFYWLVMLSDCAFGVSEFSARFVSALAATTTIGMVFVFARHWLNERAGLCAAMVLATCMLFIGIGRMTITDMTLTCVMTGATLSLFMAAHRDIRWWLVSGFFAGLAVLTKGPVGIVLPGAIFCIYTLMIGRFKACFLNRWLPLAVLTCVLIAMPWYLLAYQANGAVFLDILFHNNVTRYADIVSGHKQPVYFYLVVLLAGFMPWSIYLPAAIKRLFQLRKVNRQSTSEASPRYHLTLFAALWAVTVLCFFTAGQSKLLTYILPLFPALGLWVGELWQHAIEQSARTGRSDRWLTLPAFLLALFSIAAGFLLVFKMPALLPREAATIASNGYNVIVAVLFVAGSVLAAFLAQRAKLLSAFWMQCATVVLVLFFSMQGIVPNVSRAAQATMVHYATITGTQPLITFEIQKPSLTYYGAHGQRQVLRFTESEEIQKPVLVSFLNKNPQTFVVTNSKLIRRFQALLPGTLQIRTVEKGPVYSLLSVIRKP